MPATVERLPSPRMTTLLYPGHTCFITRAGVISPLLGQLSALTELDLWGNNLAGELRVPTF